MTGAGVLFLPQLWYIAYTIYPSQMPYFQRTSWFWSTLCIDKCIKPIFFAEISRSGHSFSCCNRLREPFRATKLQKGTKIDPWLNIKKECQGRMSQLRLRVFICYRLLFVAKRNVTPYFADGIGMDVQERGDVL